MSGEGQTAPGGLEKEIRRRLRRWPGARRADLTRVFSDPALLGQIVSRLAQPFAESGITQVAGIEAQGAILAGGLARELGAGVVLIRREGRIPWGVVQEKVASPSGPPDILEMAQDALTRKDKVLLVSDWSETGSQLKASASLIRRLGASVAGVCCMTLEPEARMALLEEGLNLVSLFPQSPP